MSNLNIKIGEIIKDARRRKNYKQEKLAELTEIARSRISQIESGIPVDDRTYKRIFQALDLDFDFVMGEESAEKAKKLEIMISEFQLIAQRNFDFARDLIRIARNIEDANEIKDDFDFIKNMTRDKWDEIRRFFGEAANGTIEINEYSPIEIAGILLEKANTSILATSLLTPETWWNSPLGEKYQAQNLNLAKKIDEDFSIERIFIFGSSNIIVKKTIADEIEKEIEKIKKIIVDEIGAKIKIWIAFNNNLPLGLAAELLIIDDKFVGLQDIKDRQIIERVRFSNNAREIEKAKRSFEMIRSLCENDHNPIENIEQLNSVIKNL